MEWMIGAFFNVVLAAGILVVGYLAAGWAKRTITDQADRYENLDETLFRFLGTLARYAIMVATIVAVLARFGVETTSLIAVIGAAGLAVGLALQGALSNVAAGIMLMIFRPFRIGQFVEAGGHAGTVKEVNLFATELATPDNVQIIIPNAAIWSGSIKNFSHHDTRRVDLVFGVAYGADLQVAEQALQGLIDDDIRIHEEPKPFLKITNLGDSSVDFTMRVWCEADEYWNVAHDLTRGGKHALDEAGVDIPFPTTTVIKGD